MTVTAPTLPAYPNGRYQWKVWCAFCERWHFHGAGPGHRVAHCACKRSPYSDRGYYLELSTDPAPKRKNSKPVMCGGGIPCLNCPAERRGRA